MLSKGDVCFAVTDLLWTAPVLVLLYQCLKWLTHTFLIITIFSIFTESKNVRSLVLFQYVSFFYLYFIYFYNSGGSSRAKKGIIKDKNAHYSLLLLKSPEELPKDVSFGRKGVSIPDESCLHKCCLHFFHMVTCLDILELMTDKFPACI